MNPADAAAKATAATAPDHIVAWLEFWGKVIAAGAWPFTVLLLAVLFAGPLRQILIRIVQFEGWGAKATFSDRVVQLAAETAVVSPPSDQAEDDGSRGLRDALAADPDKSGGTLEHRFYSYPVIGDGRSTSLSDPHLMARMVIVAAWEAIEEAIRDLYRSLRGTEPPDTLRTIDKLSSAGIIPDPLHAQLHHARLLNKDVRYGRAPTMSAAIVYSQSAAQLVEQIRALMPAVSSPGIPQKPPETT